MPPGSGQARSTPAHRRCRRLVTAAEDHAIGGRGGTTTTLALMRPLGHRRLSIQIWLDIKLAKAHHSGYGNSAAPARRSTAAVRLVRSALLAANTAAPTAEAPSFWYLKNSQLHPALRIRLA